MAEDPRKFVVKNCLAAQNTQSADDQKKKSFFDSLSKVGDIEVLNRFGAGKITAGLRTLTKVSDSVRTGETDSAIIPNSSGYVLDAVGINPNAAQAAGAFNPGVLNRGTAQADSILQDVRSGNYTLDDIPNTFSDLQNLDTLTSGIYTDDSGQSSTKAIEVCGASPYAIDLIRYAPKYKFLFVVEITLNPEYTTLAKLASKLAFVVKSSTRPNVNIEHEEVNMYNFWTRVPKRTVFEPITMRFYDDNKGKAHKFYTSYLRNISPITRKGGMDESGILSVPWLEANSMNFNSRKTDGTASISALEGTRTTMIKEIKTYHIFDYGKFMNVYHYHHPKILSMNLDELDVAENGNGNEIEIQFAYDSLYITPELAVIANKEKLKGMTGGDTAAYPIKANFYGDKTEEQYLQGDDDDDDDSSDDNGFGEPSDDSVPEPEATNVYDGVSGPFEPRKPLDVGAPPGGDPTFVSADGSFKSFDLG